MRETMIARVLVAAMILGTAALALAPAVEAKPYCTAMDRHCPSGMLVCFERNGVQACVPDPCFTMRCW